MADVRPMTADEFEELLLSRAEVELPDGPGRVTADVLSNFDRSVTPGAEAALRAGGYGDYAAWNFHGTVLWHDGGYYCRVTVHRVVKEVVGAGSLKELMEAVADRYGWD